MLLAELLEAMGVREVRLRLASLGSPETRSEYRAELTAYLRAHEERLSPEVRSRIELNPMRAFDASDPGTRAVMRDAPTLLDRLDAEDAEHFAAVRALLEDAGLRYELDPTLVRGLDYYTRTLFEFTSDALGAQSGVAGGGRYDRLIEQLDGPRTPACGWAAGVERILLAGSEQPIAPPLVDVFVARGRRRRPAGVPPGARGARGRAGGPARARRAVAEGPAQARRPARRALRGDRRRRGRGQPQGDGVRRAARAQPRRGHPGDPAGGTALVDAPAAPQRATGTAGAAS